jgi:hypothetical protein
MSSESTMLDEVEVLWDEILAVVHDEYAAIIELDVIALLLGLEKIKWRTDDIHELLTRGVDESTLPLWNEKYSLELKLSFDGEMLDI